MYLLAAVLAPPERSALLRDDLRALVPGNRDRIHWRDESPALKHEFAGLIAASRLAGLVVVGFGVDQRKQERARRHCMEELVRNLAQLDVGRIWIENRTASLNRGDLRMVDALRSKKVLAPSVRVDFARPSEDPMLWIADALASSSGMARKGREIAYRRRMGPFVREIELDIR